MNDNNNSSATAVGGVAKKLMMAGAGLLLLVVGGFAGPAIKDMLSSPPAGEQPATDAAAATSDQPALYTSLHPPLVVNLKDASGESHYIQITMDVMARDAHVIDAVKQHSPAIRNSLILLYGSNVDYDAVNTRDGKEKMLANALAEIQKIMRERIGTDGVEAVYFTSLIIQ